MNATKKTGGTRAVYGLEAAIEDTRARLAGSAKDLQRRAQAALGPSLTTEKDGRLFAIATLERVQKANADEACAYPFGSGATSPFRTLPQWDGLQKDLFRIFHEGTEAAQLGFCSIITDAMAEDIGKNIDAYRELEGEGKFLPWGTLGTEYKAPKVTAPTKAQAAAAKAAVAKAKGPKIPIAEAEAVERFLMTTGLARRAALAFLTRPYADMAKIIKADKNTAAGFAEIAAALQSCGDSYFTIAAYVLDAKRDIQRAIAERRDGAAILKRAQRAHDKQRAR